MWIQAGRAAACVICFPFAASWRQPPQGRVLESEGADRDTAPPKEGRVLQLRAPLDLPQSRAIGLDERHPQGPRLPGGERPGAGKNAPDAEIVADKFHILPAEGLNNKIRVIPRSAYGYRDEDYLKLKVTASFLPPLSEKRQIAHHTDPR